MSNKGRHYGKLKAHLTEIYHLHHKLGKTSREIAIILNGQGVGTTYRSVAAFLSRRRIYISEHRLIVDTEWIRFCQLVIQARNLKDKNRLTVKQLAKEFSVCTVTILKYKKMVPR